MSAKTDHETIREIRNEMKEEAESFVVDWARKNARDVTIGDVYQFVDSVSRFTARKMNLAWEVSRDFHAALPDAQKPPKPSDGREWVILKSGHFYRPDRSGYTSEVIAAGLYSEGDAKAEAAIEPDIMRARHVSEYRTEIEAARANVARFAFV